MRTTGIHDDRDLVASDHWVEQRLKLPGRDGLPYMWCHAQLDLSRGLPIPPSGLSSFVTIKWTTVIMECRPTAKPHYCRHMARGRKGHYYILKISLTFSSEHAVWLASKPSVILLARPTRPSICFLTAA